MEKYENYLIIESVPECGSEETKSAAYTGSLVELAPFCRQDEQTTNGLEICTLSVDAPLYYRAKLHSRIEVWNFSLYVAILSYC